MRTLTRTPRPPTAGGEGLKLAIPELEKLGVSLRTSEVSMVAGDPGAGKSTVATAIALRSGEPTLYICSDTSEHTIRVRLAAMITGLTQREVEDRMDADLDYARTVQAPGDHIRWAFPSNPTPEDIELQVWAYVEVMGAFPRLIVVDNLMDVSLDSGDEWAALRAGMMTLKRLAKMTSSAVLVLHHTSESYTSYTAPTMRSIQGKVSQLPALIVTVAKEHDLLTVAVVKNRYGAASPDGTKYERIRFDGERMRLG